MTRDANELLERCSRGDWSAWRELISLYRPEIVRVLVRVSSADDVNDVSDLEQELWARITRPETLQRLRRREDASLKAFLCTVALNVARDSRRRSEIRYSRETFDRVGLEGAPDDPNMDPELQHADRECHRQAFDAAREEVRSERDLLIFLMYYRGGASASEIAAVPGMGLSAKGVESVICRLTRRVRRRLGTDA